MDSGIVACYDFDNDGITTVADETSELSIMVLPDVPVELRFTEVSMTNFELGDPTRLEAGETVTNRLEVVDKFGNVVGRVKNNQDTPQDTSFSANIAISGSAQSNGSNNLNLSMPSGVVEFPVTDEVIEDVDLNVTVNNVTTIPEFNTEQNFVLRFVKPWPAISDAAFQQTHNNVNPPIIFTYTEAIEKTDDTDPVVVKLNNTIINGTYIVDNDQVTFTLSQDVELNRCYEFDTGSSTWVGVDEQDPVLVQQGTACSPQVAIPQQFTSYALEESSQTLELLFGEGIDRNAISAGRVFVNEIESVFNWVDGSFVMPNFSDTGIADGTEVSLGLEGDYAGKKIHVANTISVRIFLIGVDFDQDGLNNEIEIELGLDPTLADTDGNGILDRDEDTDGDGLTNIEEVDLGTNPNNTDSDGDGLSDFDEVNQYNTDPNKADTDGDGVSDGTDCSPNDDTVYPGAQEICDGKDNNCNEETDEECDKDNDDYCDINMTVVGTPLVCPNGGGDCKDGIFAVNPGAKEECDGYDNDCDGQFDEGCKFETGIFRLTDADYADTDVYQSGENVYLEVYDFDRNTDSGALDTLVVHITSNTENQVGTPAAATLPVADENNVGNGTMSELTFGDLTYDVETEDWTAVCSEISNGQYYFTLTGSISGELGTRAEADVEYDGVFIIESGSTAFEVGDTFTFSTLAADLIYEEVTLTEIDVDEGLFRGSIALDDVSGTAEVDGNLDVSRGDNINAVYNDLFDEWGNRATVRDIASFGAYVVPAGSITADTIWTASDSPYLISGDVVVEQGVTLTIEPGVEIRFVSNTDSNNQGRYSSYSELIIRGTLNAVGTDADKILFTSNALKKVPGGWGCIYFRDGGAGTLSYCEIEYANDGVYGNSHNSITIENSTISNNSGSYGIYLYTTYSNVSVTIQNNHITGNNFNFSIDVEARGINESVDIIGNRIENNTIHYGIRVRGDQSGVISVVQDNWITGNNINSYAIHGYRANNIDISNNNIESNTGGSAGIYSYDSNNASISNNTVTGNSSMSYGIYIRDKGNNGLISGNTVTDNTNAQGLYIYGNDQNSLYTPNITDNTLTGNNYGVYVTSYAQPEVHNNNIYDNSQYNFYNTTSYEINARFNWWGDTATAEMETGGNPKNISTIYDFYDNSSYGMVNYSGWLDADGGNPVITTTTGILRLTDANYAKADVYQSGENVYVEVEDFDRNTDSGALDTLVIHITSDTENQAGTPATATLPVADENNVGDGTMSELTFRDFAYDVETEDWTAVCTEVSDGHYYFTLTGNISGDLGTRAEADVEYDGVFIIENGSTAFEVGDTFTFSTIAANIIYEEVTLTETDVDTGLFHGSIALDDTTGTPEVDGDLDVSRGDDINAVYNDLFDEWGNSAVVRKMATFGAFVVPAGFITVDTTWTASQSPYLISGDVMVDSGVTLTIEPGVDVRFVPNTSSISLGRYQYDSELIINGTLNAVGTDASKILFTSNAQKKTPGDWGCIYFYSGGAGTLSYCKIEYANDGVYGDGHNSITIGNSTISNNSGSYGIYLNTDYSNVAVSIQDNHITGNNFSRSIYVDTRGGGASFDISGNRIENNTIGYGIRAYGNQSSVISVVQDNWITGNNIGSYAIYGYGAANIDISNNTIESNTGGLGGIYGSGDTSISNNTVTGNSSMTYGIRIQGSGNLGLVNGNTVTDNTSASGIYISWSYQNLLYTPDITDNTLTGNYYGVYVTSDVRPEVHNNNIYNNSQYDFYNDTSYDINARFNWWGDTTTAEMETGGNPKNISVIYDFYDNSSYGTVNYSGWMDTDGGNPVTTTTTGIIRLTDADYAAEDVYQSGENVYIEVEDFDRNTDSGALDTLVVHITSDTENQAGTPAASTLPVADENNVGDGTMSELTFGDFAYDVETEDWTSVCSEVSDGHYYFTLTGSISGERAMRAEAGVEYESVFIIENGSTAFEVGDTFTFSTTAADIIYEEVTLTETDVDTGLFHGSIALDDTTGSAEVDGDLDVGRGDSINAVYEDILDDWGYTTKVRRMATFGAFVVPAGSINTDTTWTASQNPYLISGDVVVDSGVTLTIEPGVEVQLCSQYRQQQPGRLPIRQ